MIMAMRISLILTAVAVIISISFLRISKAIMNFLTQYGLFALEAFTLAFSQFIGSADQLTVISWVLPQTDQTKGDLRKETAYPPESCVRARIFSGNCWPGNRGAP